MLLSRIFLHHWHRFYSTTIDVDGGLCLTGPDDTDSAAVLDAVQLALVGDPARVRFTPSRYGFTCDLDSYARGRLAEDKWQRPGNTVSYVILEFSQSPGSARLTLGLCIETGPRLAPEITWFILPEPLSPATFVTKGRPLPRVELKPLLRSWRGAQFYEKPLDYQTELLNRLGGLDDRFLDLFQRALHFRPVGRADEFVFAWLVDERPLDPSTLSRMRERLAELNAESGRLEKQIAALQPIVNHQAEMRRFAELRDQQTVLLALLQSAAAARRLAALESQISNLQALISNANTELDAARAARDDLEIKLREAERLEFENGISHRRSILQWQSKYAAQTADNIRDRWLAIQRQLKAEADGLRPLLKTSGLELDELAALNGLLNQVDAASASGPLAQGEPPPPALAATLDSAIPALSFALARLNAERTRLADLLDTLARQSDQLQRRLEPLTTQPPNHPTALPAHVLRMQELLTPVVGKKPPLLYEFIDAPDPRWQNAVEAVLGPARFHAIVSATWYDAAKSALLAARANEDLGDADVHDPTQAYNRPASPRSLAEKVTTIYPDLRAYLDSMLGDIITCEWPDELRLHPRAVTPDVTLHSEWQMRTVSPAEYLPIVVGKNAARLQAEARQRQAFALQSQISELKSQISNLKSQIAGYDSLLACLNHVPALAVLRRELDEPLDERPARAEAAAFEAELGSINTAPVDELRRRAEALRADITRQSRTKEEIAQRLLSLEFDLRTRQSELSTARIALDEGSAQTASTRDRFPAEIAAAESMQPDHLQADDLSESIRSVELREKEFDRRARDERLRLIEAISAFNAVHQLGKWPGDPADPIYAQAQQRLSETDLPRVRAQTAAAEREMEDELNDHILRPLREGLLHVHHALEQINDTLAGLGAPCRLHAEPAPGSKDFYSLILEERPQRSGGEDPAKSKDAAQTLIHFYEVLTTQPEAAGRLTDYRRYFNYSIEVTGADGQAARLARADDEARIAFYMAIAASFAQTYRIRGDRVGRPCIRLAPFGALFAQMDAAQIAPTLDLFRRLGLQIAAAVPLERSDYLISGLPTTVVLTPAGSSVMAEPYRNYAASPQP